MAPSFTFPPNLLHKTTEPQWFPRPKEENESSLDALEAAEEAHAEFLRSIAQKEAPDPIGAAPTAGPNTSQQQTQPYEVTVAPAPAPVDVSYGGRPHFWNQPRTPAPATPAPTHRVGVPDFS